MPSITLVVCLRNETANLERLLRHSSGCFDELLVVHDGAETVPTMQKSAAHLGTGGLERAGAPPAQLAMDYAALKKGERGPKGYRLVSGNRAKGGLGKLVARYHGRLYEGPRCFQQEPHWPFAWWQARHEWILRLDADEYPSSKMQLWLKEFRKTQRIPNQISGFTCVWPFWDGCEEFVFDRIEWRPFLIHKHRVSFIGMVEQGPIARTAWKNTGLTLRHRPSRPSFGLSYVFCRRQSHRWRQCIAASLMHQPIDLPRWNYSLKTWPNHWAKIILHPWSTGVHRFLRVLASGFLRAKTINWRYVRVVAFGPAFHQLFISWSFGFHRMFGKIRAAVS